MAPIPVMPTVYDNIADSEEETAVPATWEPGLTTDDEAFDDVWDVLKSMGMDPDTEDEDRIPTNAKAKNCYNPATKEIAMPATDNNDDSDDAEREHSSRLIKRFADAE